MLSATLLVGVEDLMANGLQDNRDMPIIPKEQEKRYSGFESCPFLRKYI